MVEDYHVHAPDSNVHTSLEIVLVDTSAFLHRKERRRITRAERQGARVLCTKGVRAEVRHITSKPPHQQVSERDMREANDLLARLERVGNIYSVDQQDDAVRTGRRVAQRVDPALSKRVLDTLVLDSFSGLYGMLLRRIPKVAKGESASDGQYEFLERVFGASGKRFNGVRSYMERRGDELPEQVTRKREEMAKRGLFDLDVYEELAAGVMSRDIKTRAYFSSVIRTIYRGVRKGWDYHTIRRECQRACMRTGSTDRNLVIAAFVLRPQSTGQVRIFTRDRDVEELEGYMGASPAYQSDRLAA